jgi:hypothetical protein
MSRKVTEQIVSHMIEDPVLATNFVAGLPSRASVAEWIKQKAFVLLAVWRLLYTLFLMFFDCH